MVYINNIQLTNHKGVTMKQVNVVTNGATLIDFEDGVPQLKTHPLNKDGYTTITKSVQNKNLYEIYDVGDSDVGFEVGDLVDGRLVQVVNNTLKIDGKCLVKVHQHSCGRYPQNRTLEYRSWGYCSPQDHIWNRPSCNSRHSNNEVNR